MLSKASFTTRSSCLQCQLRQVIFHPRQVPPCLNTRGTRHCRNFNVSSRNFQSDEEEVAALAESNAGDEKGKGISYRSLSLGRIVGKPGRRQRERSETLKIDSMKRPFDVVVMRDVPEVKEQRPPTLVQGSSESTGLVAAQIAKELSQQDEEPNQDEVDQSIDALRPETSIISLEQFNDLLEQLVESYNNRQLSSYFTKSLNLSSIENDTVHLIDKDLAKTKGRLRRSTWRPGKTPLEQRHGYAAVVKKSELGTNKSKLAQQILRLAWNLTIHSEGQEVGELEMSMKSWQIRYLFDVVYKGMANYERMIHSPLLLRASEVRPYRPDNILRVIARRQDAEHIAELIENKLSHVGMLTVKLSSFVPLLDKPGRPSTIAQLLPDSDLKDVEQQTFTVIERPYISRLEIYHRDEPARQHARRLIISLLDLPSPISTKVISPEKSVEANSVLLPEYAGSYLPFRYRNLALSRLVTPVGKATAEPEVQSRDRLEYYRSEIAKHLRSKREEENASTKSLERSFPSSQDVCGRDRAPFWKSQHTLDEVPWEIQFCKVLRQAQQRASRKPPRSGGQYGVPVVSPQIPRVDALISDTHPKDAIMHTPSLIAHFLPSPVSSRARDAVSNMHGLPRIQIIYHVVNNETAAESSTDRTHLELRSVSATLSGEELCIPLPNEAADLRILRINSVSAKMGQVQKDEEIRRFTRSLSRSLNAGNAILTGEPVIKFKLAPDMIQNGARGDEHKEVEYLFERFEQMQTVAFVPPGDDEVPESMDAALRKVLNDMPANSRLCYSEISAGIAGGSRTELSLRYRMPYAALAREEAIRSSNHGGMKTEAQDLEEFAKRTNMQLVDTALGLASYLTRINAGNIRPAQVSLQDPKSSD